ncbi:type II toxin-antitoxin system Phd/YefM family antitoxin [Aminipila sp.]|uniref:type II toxin-antitoxin system Phd/YefM family antitoxin n=1 Tax=Aminipila sp. TaxID=2060095 RepID=UPI00289B1963|nr:type II toxin-antitoxin system Phd/YefM family antitoxin [Aminipila sp.]
MQTINVTSARNNLFNLINEVNESHEPVQILGKKGNAVIISEDDWRAIEEMLYLLSVPGLAKSIKEGVEMTIDECIPESEVNW